MKKEILNLLIILCVFTHLVRFIYEILKHKDLLRPGRLSFAVVFTDMILLWVSWFLICRYDPHEIHFPAIIRYSALALSVTGMVIFLSGLFTLKALESYDGDLMTTGIYAYISHPIYLGFISWLIGFPLFFEALIPLILSVFFIINVLFWRFLEEKELEHRFPAYREYRKKTIF